jgi:membrane-associated HD superfamily phosphohydrolase
MCTPEGVPIEENIRIAEEAIRQRAEREHQKQREKELQKERELEERLRQKIEQEVEAKLRQKIEQERVSSGEDNMTTVTLEEIEQFRKQLGDYPEAIANLDVIEACEGDLEDAAYVLARRAGAEEVRFASNWLEQGLKQCRYAICGKELKDDSLPELLAAVKESLAASSQPFLVALETPVALYIAKVGVNNFCKSTDSALGRKKVTLRQNWAGGLKDYANQSTSLELQQKALEWRGD